MLSPVRLSVCPPARPSVCPSVRFASVPPTSLLLHQHLMATRFLLQPFLSGVLAYVQQTRIGKHGFGGGLVPPNPDIYFLQPVSWSKMSNTDLQLGTPTTAAAVSNGKASMTNAEPPENNSILTTETTQITSCTKEGR